MIHGNVKNEKNKKFGKLTTIEYLGKSKWKCLCDCGNFTEVHSQSLRTGNTKSCGCLKIEKATKHGYVGTPIYRCYNSMKNRCYNINNPSYSDYGGRGIKVCERWKDSFNNFLVDMGERPSKDYSIDRIDNDGNYEPNNCKWSTAKEQNRNNRQVKLNENKVKKIKKLLLNNIKQKDIAIKFRIDQSIISDIKRNKIWRNI